MKPSEKKSYKIHQHTSATATGNAPTPTVPTTATKANTAERILSGIPGSKKASKSQDAKQKITQDNPAIASCEQVYISTKQDMSLVALSTYETRATSTANLQQRWRKPVWPLLLSFSRWAGAAKRSFRGGKDMGVWIKGRNDACIHSPRDCLAGQAT